MKPSPYCTPAMLRVLRGLAGYETPVAADDKICSALKSRGWIDDRRNITPSGLDYVNLRASLTQKGR